MLTGTVEGGRVDEDAVVAVADGRIVAVSPVVFRNIGGSAFALLLPLDGSAGSARSAWPSCAEPSSSTAAGSSTDRGLALAPLGGGRRVRP